MQLSFFVMIASARLVLSSPNPEQADLVSDLLQKLKGLSNSGHGLQQTLALQAYSSRIEATGTLRRDPIMGLLQDSGKQRFVEQPAEELITSTSDSAVNAFSFHLSSAKF